MIAPTAGAWALVLAVVAILGFGAFFWRAWRLYRYLRLGRDEGRTDRMWRRVRDELVVYLGQRKLLKRPYRVRGMGHALIYWGFLVITYGTTDLLLSGIFGVRMPGTESGVDVWMNNPRRPMEASGTSGMKAAMNGAPNLSVLDGWWPEGFQGDNGWVIGGERDIGDEQLRDAEDADSLYHVLQHDVIPTYYRRSERGFSDDWVYISKRAMITSIPYFNTDRMVAEYVERFYVPASRHGQEMAAEGFARAKGLAAWKARVRAAWPQTRLEAIDAIPDYSIWDVGQDILLRVKVGLGGLAPEDVCVEVLFFRPARDGGYVRDGAIELTHETDGLFAANIRPDDTGNYRFEVRMYPHHPDLPHPMAMGLMTTL